MICHAFGLIKIGLFGIMSYGFEGFAKTLLETSLGVDIQPFNIVSSNSRTKVLHKNVQVLS